ncbi:amidase [Amaricoccus sp.]|uniref:amidase n=1 Tax=Amaricoccus sp. TaxID=1872485 RepID=UPI001B63F9BE|nr:amidase family protein [Amaricoccus sp.]MBP7001048.1 amidase [Amaricoccus sp.]
MTAAELGRGIGEGAIDPRALAETYLAAIAAHPEAARIYVRATPARARAEAGAAAERARLGLRRGPLDGVPVSWKDLFDLAGEPTEAGSALLRGRVAARDGAVVASAARAGLVSLGKTHLSELAFSGLGINPVTATSPNINDPGLAPGGSSSGAAASVAFGLAAAAIGSDTAGSARVPAAWNDLVGFKPTHGALPLDGATPLRPGFDTVGPLCRSVEDAGLMLAALSGGPAADLGGATLARTRLLVLEDAEVLPTDEAPAAAFAAALERVAAGGARIERGLPAAVAEVIRLWPTVAGPEAYGVWRAAIEADPEVMWPPIRDRFRLGAAISGADYVAALRALDAVRAGWAAATAGYDAVLLPTTANLPPRVERLLADPAYFAAENLKALRNPNLANLLRLCALSVPTGIPACGVMVLAPAGGEGRLLRLGAAIERALA